MCFQFTTYVGDAKGYFKFNQKCVFFKFKEVHLFNVSPAVRRAYWLLKFFIKKKLRKHIIFHLNLESLRDDIGIENLPSDYGGGLKSVDELYHLQFKRNVENRKLLTDFEIFRIF